MSNMSEILNPDKSVPPVIGSATVSIPRSEYDDLKAARFAIDILGQTLGRYGVNDAVATQLLWQFGYCYTEESDA